MEIASQKAILSALLNDAVYITLDHQEGFTKSSCEGFFLNRQGDTVAKTFYETSLVPASDLIGSAIYEPTMKAAVFNTARIEFIEQHLGLVSIITKKVDTDHCVKQTAKYLSYKADR